MGLVNIEEYIFGLFSGCIICSFIVLAVLIHTKKKRCKEKNAYIELANYWRKAYEDISSIPLFFIILAKRYSVHDFINYFGTILDENNGNGDDEKLYYFLDNVYRLANDIKDCPDNYYNKKSNS